MRITNGLIVRNFLSDLQSVQQRIARLQRMTATGRAFERAGENPAGSAISLNLHSALSYLNQYSRNIDDGISRLTVTESKITEVDSQLQRLRELTVQAANSYLTRDDRRAIAEEVDQLLEHVITIANSNFRGRYIFSGYETLTEAFTINSNTSDSLTNSITYRGDLGNIDRNIGINRDLDINFNGKEIFTSQTYQLTGKQLPDTPLGFNGTFEVNNQLFVVTPNMNLTEIRDMLNQVTTIDVHAFIDSDLRLNLESLNSSLPVDAKDLSGTVLSDLGLTEEGAFNLALTAPTLPLIDSRGAIHTSAAVVYPLTLSTGTRDLVVTLGGAANNTFTETKVLELDAVTYNTAADLVAEIQKKADLAFGEDKLIVNDLGGGVIEVETYVQSGLVAVGDLVIGGTAPDGTVDSVSDLIGLNAVPSVQEVADIAGFDGNDRFTVDLGLAAYRISANEQPIDLPMIELNLDATAAIGLQSLVDEINLRVLDNEFLSGLIEASDVGGRLQIETTKTGQAVLGTDLLLANAVTGPVLPATNTLGALGMYVDPLTGISAPPVPATVFSTASFPPGVAAIAAGVNDQFAIDLGAASSIDGSNPGPVTLTLTPGAYPTALAMATEINQQISRFAGLQGAVTAVVRTVGPLDFVDIITVNDGSRVQTEDLTLTDVIPGTLANLGLLAPTTPGGGSADGQGIVQDPHNLIDTMIQIRDELIGVAARSSRLVDLEDEAGNSLGLFAGDKIRINSDGTSLEFTVQRFTTMQDLADRVEEKLGFGLKVQVLRDGKIEIFNPTTSVINDISIEAIDQHGQKVTAFEKAMQPISGKLFYRSVLRSDTVYEDERFQDMTFRIGDVDDAFETVLSALAELGSKSHRLDLTMSQNNTAEVNLAELQTKNDYVDMAETITKLKEQENVLQASLGTGARIIPPSLFDFLF